MERSPDKFAREIRVKRKERKKWNQRKYTPEMHKTRENKPNRLVQKKIKTIQKTKMQKYHSKNC